MANDISFSKMAVVTFIVVFSFFLICSPASATLKHIDKGGVIFGGESDIDICSFWNSTRSTTFGMWPPGQNINSSAPQTAGLLFGSISVPCSLVSPGFWGYNNYLGYSLQNDGVTPYPDLQFITQDPTLDIKIWDVESNQEITGQFVPQGHHVTFKITTNMYQATSRSDANPSTDGFISIVVIKPDGSTSLSSLYDSTLTPISLQNLYVTTSDFTWGNGKAWATDVKDSSGNSVYPSGIYTVYAVSNLNEMRDVVGGFRTSTKNLILQPITATTSTTATTSVTTLMITATTSITTTSTPTTVPTTVATTTTTLTTTIPTTKTTTITLVPTTYKVTLTIKPTEKLTPWPSSTPTEASPISLAVIFVGLAIVVLIERD